MTKPAVRVALITGAGSGIGAAICLRLANEHLHVCCADLRLDAAEATAKSLQARGYKASAHVLDVRDEMQWEELMAAMACLHDGLAVLVHCAGISSGSPLMETSLAEWQRIMATNLDGAFLATKHGMRAMRENGGVLLLIGSASGVRPAAGAAAYSTSKAAIGMLVRAAAKECLEGHLPIRICSLSPAGVKTPMWTSMPFFQDMVSAMGSEDAAFDAIEKSGGGRFASPEEVAGVAAFLVSDAASHVHGVDFLMDDGYVL